MPAANGGEKAIIFFCHSAPKSHIMCEHHQKLHQHWKLAQRETASAEDPTCTQILNQLQSGSADQVPASTGSYQVHWLTLIKISVELIAPNCLEIGTKA